MHGWMKIRKRGGCSDADGLESCLDEDVELELVPSGRGRDKGEGLRRRKKTGQ